MDPFSVLDIPHTASLQDVKAAYRRLAKRHHPDYNGNIDSSEFQSVSEAFEMVCSESKLAEARREYISLHSGNRRLKSHKETRPQQPNPPPVNVHQTEPRSMSHHALSAYAKYAPPKTSSKGKLNLYDSSGMIRPEREAVDESMPGIIRRFVFGEAKPSHVDTRA